MKISEWVKELDQNEAGYARRYFRFWKGSNGNREPEIPWGMSKVHADVLKYHTQSLIDTTQRRRKMEETKTITFRASEKLERDLAFEASEIDVNKSIYIRACIEAGRPIVKAHPKIINFFSDVVIPK